MSTKKTGWEALEGWVSDGTDAVENGSAHVARAGTTGWEDLDKWVSASPASEGDAVASGPKTTGWEALDKWVGDDGASAGSGAGTTGQAAPRRGFMGWLKGLFGGK